MHIATTAALKEVSVRSNSSTMSLRVHSSPFDEDPYDTFLECNCLGVANLMNGNLPVAYRHLSAAFSIARQEVVALGQEESPLSTTASDETSTHVAPQRPAAPHAPLAPWPLLSRDEVVRTLSLTMTFDLRTDGIMISPDVLVRRGDGLSFGRDDWTLASAFAVYNIGVVYLIAGAQVSTEAHFNKARMMFESCIGLLLSSFRSDRQALNRESPTALRRLCPTGNPIVDVLSLFVLAKTSQAYHFLSRYDGARAYAGHLGAFVRLLRGDGGTYVSGDDAINRLVESHCDRLACELSSILDLESLAPAA
mmetsp:Transcript_131522/g.195986  ORF Transcript_131522/g.195986 Transcript_131522/m.195986 type:complete len:308 (-) Transcript_131522:76-999(-)|eukprot:CAMPEP_0117045416 /NCGR_PEP_ID=MMETSP0472-20121206/31424_1 /TAXON_ID=693140 ORGANISM="Tiarina fusus, Strain LIS" /NCGR_SAMPLE_ID=MMETSP0472 /ASSEMBLY_ACC=CAM_ASM_000603 /LENGTH=307 /DNA_ID=CAMNT_0004757419 /DNA_START=55 /DNA_END=978 /DNA_ORIENTATION=+